MDWIKFFLIVIAIGITIYGFVAGRGVKPKYYVSYFQKSGFWSIYLTIIATVIGGWMIFGLAAVGYDAGIAGYFMGIGYFIGLLSIGLSVNKIKGFMADNNCDLVDDIILKKFGSNTRLVFAIVQFCILLCIVGAQFLSLDYLISMYGEDYYNLGFILLLAVILYASFSGFRGVIKTDKIQIIGALLPIVLLGIPILIRYYDIPITISFQEKRIGASPEYGIPFIVGAVVLFAPSIFVRNEFWQRVRAAKDVNTARLAFIFAAFTVLLVYVIITSLGMIGSEILSDKSINHQLSMLELMRQEGWMNADIINYGLLVTIILTLTSTIDSYLNVAASVVSKVVDKAKWDKYYTEDAKNVEIPAFQDVLIRRLRTISLMVGVLGVLLAKFVDNVVDLVIGASSSLIVFLPVTFYSIVLSSKDKYKVSPRTGLTSLVLGYLCFIIFAILFNIKTAFIPGFLVAFIVFLIGRYIDIKK